MMRHPLDASQCPSQGDITTLILSLGLCTGLIISYLPQHYRIISAKSSEGFSPWFLLLGATSSASGMLNILIRQWPLFRCCRIISGGQCFESLLGFIQVTLQWFLFTIILVLYLVYFPAHLKYQRILPITEAMPGSYGAVNDTRSGHARPEASATRTDSESAQGDVHSLHRTSVQTTPEWRLAVTLGIVVTLHLALLLALTLYLLLNIPDNHPDPSLPPGTTPADPLLSHLATFLGVSATLLAVMQYAPQIYKTYKAQLVGALSLGTMVIQVPGSVLFVVSIAVRQGTDWTSWLAYAVTGGMQGALLVPIRVAFVSNCCPTWDTLVLCLLWRQRQKKLGIDDFGNPVSSFDGIVESETLLPENET